jgi:hypothetical protein
MMIFEFNSCLSRRETRCASAVLSRRSADEFLFSLSLSLCAHKIYQEEAESTDEEGEPKQKKQKTDKKKKKKKQDNSDSENSDVIDDLSGDEVDQSNIIAGGRASRSTRPVFTKQMYAAANLEDESEDEE